MKRRILFGMVTTAAIMSSQFAGAVSPTPDEMAEARRWAAAKVEGNGETTAGQAGRQYQAQWIWCNAAPQRPIHFPMFGFARFRKTIEVASPPERATAYITADTYYRLWVNGQLAMHGPARSSRGKATVDPVDVGHLLKQGKNTLLIQVFHGMCPSEAIIQAPGLLCELEAMSGGKRAIIAATGATWEAAEIVAWDPRQSFRFTCQRGWVEDYDARRELEEKWQPAVVLGSVGMAPWRRVSMRDVPMPAPLLPVRPAKLLAAERGDGFVGKVEPGGGQLQNWQWDLSRSEWDRRAEWFRRLETERLRADAAAAVNPMAVTSKGTGDTLLQGDGASIAYDFGLGYVGFVGFEVTGHAGQVVEIAWNERLSGDNAVRPRAQAGNNAVRYTLREGRQSFLAFHPQFVRFLRIVQRGQGQLTLHRL